MNDEYTAALDVGERRIGIAVANNSSKLAVPLATLQNDEDFMTLLPSLLSEHKVGILVVGLPRGMEGQETAQTKYARDFAAKLKSIVSAPIYLQDEAGTSAQARQELEDKGKPYNKADIDALAATYILQDFMDTRLVEALSGTGGRHE